ncbi:MAG: DUF3750 domain-containing protein [Gammaproteobacteria bacterium]|nr:DUF3750 domain-containing protein [Gammaproteobacteria bacterium]MYB38174.1 DUF3750 domain-containing protein [Gammaproteobacteria bacterium]
MKKSLVWITGSILALFVLPAVLGLAHRAYLGHPHWREASHAPTGLSPAPQAHPDAVVQVFAARTWGTRGGVAVHTWIATKRQGDDHYRRHEVIGWRLRRGIPALASGRDNPDAQWFSNPPQLLVDRRGEGVEAIIDAVEAAVASYPYANEYRTWPGPNSNTFTAHVGRQVPALGLDLPPTAIGKDFLPNGAMAARSPGGGLQVSFFGALGLLASPREGVEVNMGSLVAGVRFWPPAIKLPGVGAWPPTSPDASGAD